MAFPNILTFTAHFRMKTSNVFLCFHYFVPTFFLIITTSSFPFLLLPYISYLYLIRSTFTKSNSTTCLTPVPTPNVSKQHTLLRSPEETEQLITMLVKFAML